MTKRFVVPVHRDLFRAWSSEQLRDEIILSLISDGLSKFEGTYKFRLLDDDASITTREGRRLFFSDYDLIGVGVEEVM